MAEEQTDARIAFIRLCAFCGQPTQPSGRVLLTFESRRWQAVSFEVHAECVKNALTEGAGHDFDLDDIVTY
jgi:hypothetical protein